MPKLCSGCGETKGTGKFTAGQWKTEVGGTCRKCNAVDNPACASGGGGGGSSKPTVKKSAKTSKAAWVPGKQQPQQCASPACTKVGKGYKLCVGCKRAYYCSELCQANHWGKKGDPDRHKVMCKALRKGAASSTPPSASSSGGGAPACASGGANWRGHASGGGNSSDPPTTPVAVGCRVQIVGVKSRPELNGAQGDVTAKDTKKVDSWHVLLTGKVAAASFHRSNLTVVAAASIDGRECYICLCADGSVISLGCACRGAAGGAHLDCAIEAAAHAEEQTDMLSWHTCALCHQGHTGPMQMGLANEAVRRVQHLPETDTKRMKANNNIAGALASNGNYAEAEVIYRKLLAISGGEDLHIAHNLASCLMFQCKYEEAIKLERHSLLINRRVYGLEHRDTLRTKQLLASVLQQNGQLEEAETMFRATLTTMKRVLPKNDKATLIAMNGFAVTLRSLGQHAEATTMLRELVAIDQQLLGPEHPDTLRSTLNLAAALSSQNKHDEALVIQRECYSSRVKVQGAMHPSTLNAAYNLANMLATLGKYAESEAIYRETLVVHRKVLGAEHEYTKATVGNLQSLIDSGHASIQTLP